MSEVVDAADMALGSRLRLVITRLDRKMRLASSFAPPPLQFSTLVTLESADPLRLFELAQREAVSSPTMSRVVVALETRGFINRVPDPSDGRGLLISISDRGRERLQDVRLSYESVLAPRLARLDPDERTAVAAAMPALEGLLVPDEGGRNSATVPG